MDVLVPIDGSECSTRALAFAAEFARRFDAHLDVVHFSDAETDATDDIRAQALDQLPADVDAEVRIVVDTGLEFRPAEHVGRVVLSLADERAYDHVIMGHHGKGAIDRAILGSAAETVLRAESVPVTIVP